MNKLIVLIIFEIFHYSKMSSHQNVDLTDDATHNNFIKFVDDSIASIIKNDPLLDDLPQNITTEELEQIVQLEHGQALKVYIKREDEKTIEIIVNRESTFHQFKKVFQKQFCLWLKRNNQEKTINWKYFWKNYNFVFDGRQLSEDNVKIIDMGFYNNCQIRFIRKIK